MRALFKYNYDLLRTVACVPIAIAARDGGNYTRCAVDQADAVVTVPTPDYYVYIECGGNPQTVDRPQKGRGCRSVDEQEAEQG